MPYATKAQLGKIFGVTFPTVQSRVEGIKEEMGPGKRYNRYAICGKLISIAVYADYEKYRKRLADKNLRKTVPEFDMYEAGKYLEGILEKEKRK